MIVLVPPLVWLGLPALARGRSVLVVAILVAAGLAYCGDQALRDRLSASLDAGVAIALLALVAAGPLAAALAFVVGDVIHLARRRRAFLNIGLVANLASYAALGLAGAGALAVVPGVAGVLVAGLTMAVANFAVARLLLETLRDRLPARQLIRGEFLALLPAEVVMLAVAAAASRLLAPYGVLALAPLAAVVYVPQLGLLRLRRAPAVARLDIERAAGVYRDALADELRLSRRARLVIADAAALAARMPVRGLSGHTLSPALRCAFEAEVCRRYPPVHANYRAPLEVQVLLVASDWAAVTALRTRALSHPEALSEMVNTQIVLDAPEALAAAHAIVQREQALTHRCTGAPRLHRLPLPRPVRAELIPQVLGRLTA